MGLWYQIINNHIDHCTYTVTRTGLDPKLFCHMMMKAVLPAANANAYGNNGCDMVIAAAPNSPATGSTIPLN
jgi:hypothetical protein